MTSMPRLSFGLAPGLLAWLLLVIVAVTSTACGGASQDETLSGPTSNPALNISFANLPEGFEVAANDGAQLRLEPVRDEDTDPAEAVTAMWVTVDARSDFGIELAKVAVEQKDLFLALPEGRFNGNQKLQTPNGLAYYARGGYRHEEVAVEEVRAFQVHPNENRLVRFHYRYPAADDSAERVGELLVLLGELSGAGAESSDQPIEAEDTAS